MMAMKGRVCQYEEMSWPQIKEMVKENRVVVFPVGTLENHGHHLPLVTDVLITQDICVKAAEMIPDSVILMPPQRHGYSPHHMDFPGTTTIKGPTFIECMLDITRSIASHGFKRVLLVNGHGSNTCWLESVARLAMIENESLLCGLVDWWSIPDLVEIVNETRDSEIGGMSHACEIETSMMLEIRPGLVDMGKAVKDISYQVSQYFPLDDFFYPSGPVKMMPYFSTISKTGAMGDPTVATKEKGRTWLEAAAKGLAGIIKEFREREIRARIDHH